MKDKRFRTLLRRHGSTHRLQSLRHKPLITKTFCRWIGSDPMLGLSRWFALQWCSLSDAEARQSQAIVFHKAIIGGRLSIIWRYWRTHRWLVELWKSSSFRRQEKGKHGEIPKITFLIIDTSTGKVKLLTNTDNSVDIVSHRKIHRLLLLQSRLLSPTAGFPCITNRPGCQYK